MSPNHPRRHFSLVLLPVGFPVISAAYPEKSSNIDANEVLDCCCHVFGEKLWGWFIRRDFAAQPQEDTEGPGCWRDGTAAMCEWKGFSISSSLLNLSTCQSIRASINHPDVFRWAAEVHINALVQSCDLILWLRHWCLHPKLSCPFFPFNLLKWTVTCCLFFTEHLSVQRNENHQKTSTQSLLFSKWMIIKKLHDLKALILFFVSN